MTLKSRIQEDIKNAMRNRDSARVSALRLLTAAIKQREVDERSELDDAEVLSIIDKQIKQRRDSASQYEAGNRPELAQAERDEIELLSNYLPTPLSDTEIDTLIDETVSETGASGVADMGRVMSQLKPRLAGRADMKAVSGRVRERLSG